MARPWHGTVLGDRFWVAKGRAVKRKVASNALDVMKHRVRAMPTRNGGRRLEAVCAALRSDLPGWKADCRLADPPRIFDGLDQWIRHRLRAAQLKPWKRGTTVYREGRARGVPDRVSRAAAAHARRWWRIAAHGALQTALPTSDDDRMRVPRLAG